MLVRHPRIPAALILLAAIALCLLYVSSYGRIVRTKDASSLDSLEATISAGNAPPATWLQYGEKLQSAHHPAEAVAAYRKCLENDPDNREIRLRCAGALSQAGDGEQLLQFLKSSVYDEPKLVIDFLDSAAGSAWRAKPEFDALRKEAIHQAMD